MTPPTEQAMLEMAMFIETVPNGSITLFRDCGVFTCTMMLNGNHAKVWKLGSDDYTLSNRDRMEAMSLEIADVLRKEGNSHA